MQLSLSMKILYFTKNKQNLKKKLQNLKSRWGQKNNKKQIWISAKKKVLELQLTYKKDGG